MGGKLDLWTYARNIRRSDRQVSSILDGSVFIADAFPFSRDKRHDDAGTAAFAPLAAAMTDYLRNELQYVAAVPYVMSNGDAVRSWHREWHAEKGGSNGFPPIPQSPSDLEAALLHDERLQILVAHGTTDVICPHFATRLVLDQVSSEIADSRLGYALYPGGHMFYARPESRAAFAIAGRSMMERSRR